MTSKNDITGDTLVTKVTSETYRDNWDRIFGKPRCVCEACKEGVLHASDCAVHNEPAVSNRLCNCGEEGRAK